MNCMFMSIEQKCGVAIKLATKIAYELFLDENNVPTELTRGLGKTEFYEKVWGVTDMGYQFQINAMRGICSLQQSMDFSMDEFEKEVDADIKRFEDFLKLHGKN